MCKLAQHRKRCKKTLARIKGEGSHNSETKKEAETDTSPSPLSPNFSSISPFYIFRGSLDSSSK